MKDKEKDKRLLIPGDAFEEEASEGLGRLSREEAEADLRELKGRMERRLRKPRMIWLPAAAAVVILLVASALYVSIFRDRGADLTDLARAEKAGADSAMIGMVEDGKTDTALIAMATPIEKRGAAGAGAVVPPEEADAYAEELFAVVENVKKEAEAEEISEVVVAEAQHEEPVAEEVIVEAVPMMQKTALRADKAAKEKADPEEKAASEKKAAPDVNADMEKRAATRDEAVVVTAAAGAVVGVADRDAAPAGGF